MKMSKSVKITKFFQPSKPQIEIFEDNPTKSLKIDTVSIQTNLTSRTKQEEEDVEWRYALDDESQELYNKMIVNDSIIDLHTRENDDLRLKNYELKDEMDEIEQERERCLETIVQAKDILKLILPSSESQEENEDRSEEVEPPEVNNSTSGNE